MQASWLLHAEHFDIAHDHARTDLPPWAERAAPRDWLAGFEGAAELFEVERPTRVGELEEPVVVPNSTAHDTSWHVWNDVETHASHSLLHRACHDIWGHINFAAISRLGP